MRAPLLRSRRRMASATTSPAPTHDDCSGGVSHGDAGSGGRSSRRLGAALAITATFLVVEVIGGIAFDSLALLSDAIHMVADVAALTLALVAQRVAARPRTPHRSYGYRRAETLAAFANGILLALGALWILREAFERWQTPHAVQGWGMLGIAVAGLVANLLSAWVLSRGEHGHNLNTRAALFHVLSDAAGSVGAIVAAALVIGFGWMRADAAVSVLLAGLVLWGAWRLVASASGVLMEGAPAGLDIDRLEETIRATPGVAGVHDLHAWEISDGFPVVTVHVVVDEAEGACTVAEDVAARLLAEHGVRHATVQPERSRTDP